MSAVVDEETVDGRTRRAEARRVRRRASLLAAASGVFGRRGYRGTSVNDVIEAAGVARGTFYQYFDGLDAVFHTLIDDFVSVLMAQVEPVDIEGPDPVGAMLENLTRVVRVLHAHPNESTLLCREAISADDTVEARLAQLDVFMHAMVVGALTKGAAAGFVRHVERKDIVATAIIGTLREVLFQAVVTRRLEVEGPDVMARAIFELAYRGLAQNGAGS